MFRSGCPSADFESKSGDVAQTLSGLCQRRHLRRWACPRAATTAYENPELGGSTTSVLLPKAAAPRP